MAPKRQSQQQKQPAPPPAPPVDSSEDEDSEEGREEEEDENASEQSDLEDSDDEQSEGDDSESEQDQPTPRPLPSAAVPADGKGPAKSDNNGAPPEETPAETSKKAFRRVWSDEDQLALLKGMIDFIELKDKDPLTNIGEFRLFVQKSLSFLVTESQLVVKIRALRFKYKDNEGKDKVFAKGNEAETFKLSRKIWGGGDKKVAGAGKRKDAGDNNGPGLAESCAVLTHEMITLCEKNVGLSANYVRARINAADESKVKLLEERWKKQKLEEANILARKKALEADILRALIR